MKKIDLYIILAIAAVGLISFVVYEYLKSKNGASAGGTGSNTGKAGNAATSSNANSSPPSGNDSLGNPYSINVFGITWGFKNPAGKWIGIGTYGAGAGLGSGASYIAPVFQQYLQSTNGIIAGSGSFGSMPVNLVLQQLQQFQTSNGSFYPYLPDLSQEGNMSINNGTSVVVDQSGKPLNPNLGGSKTSSGSSSSGSSLLSDALTYAPLILAAV